MERNLPNLKAGQINDYQYVRDAESSADGEGWEDITSQTQVNTNGQNVPEFVLWNGSFYCYKFSVDNPTTALKQCYTTFHIPHSYSLKNSGIFVHLHVVNLFVGTVNAPNNQVCFTIDCSYAKLGSTWSATVSQNIVFTYPSNQGQLHMVFETANPFFAGLLEVDSLVTCRISRDHNNVLDTTDYDVILLFVDAHIQVGKFATRYRNKAIGNSFYG